MTERLVFLTLDLIAQPDSKVCFYFGQFRLLPIDHNLFLSSSHADFQNTRRTIPLHTRKAKRTFLHMPGDDRSSSRGTGFVHLNTPASIEYTAGQTLSLSALRQRKSRVECVVLPESMAVWRRAFQRYAKEEGYGSYAADVEDERMGNGVVLPPLVRQRSGPQRRRAQGSVSARDAFFCSPRRSQTQSAAGAGIFATGDAAAPLSASTDTSGSASPSSQAPSGITIVSHHKVAGRQQFVYPDHDGVLSAGVVPQIVVTAEEKAEEAAAKAFYISALDMTEEELAALEELQMLWKSRARSHSFLGSQHRSVVRGSTDPTATANDARGEEEGDVSLGRHRPLKSRRIEGGRRDAADNTAGFADAEMAVDDASTLDKELAEALRMADELLRFA